MNISKEWTRKKTHNTLKWYQCFPDFISFERKKNWYQLLKPVVVVVHVEAEMTKAKILQKI